MNKVRNVLSLYKWNKYCNNNSSSLKNNHELNISSFNSLKCLWHHFRFRHNREIGNNNRNNGGNNFSPEPWTTVGAWMVDHNIGEFTDTGDVFASSDCLTEGGVTIFIEQSNDTIAPLGCLGVFSPANLLQQLCVSVSFCDKNQIKQLKEYL